MHIQNKIYKTVCVYTTPINTMTITDALKPALPRAQSPIGDLASVSSISWPNLNSPVHKQSHALSHVRAKKASWLAVLSSAPLAERRTNLICSQKHLKTSALWRRIRGLPGREQTIRLEHKTAGTTLHSLRRKIKCPLITAHSKEHTHQGSALLLNSCVTSTHG